MLVRMISPSSARGAGGFCLHTYHWRQPPSGCSCMKKPLRKFFWGLQTQRVIDEAQPGQPASDVLGAVFHYGECTDMTFRFCPSPYVSGQLNTVTADGLVR
jgi:hypothetical protein